MSAGKTVLKIVFGTIIIFAALLYAMIYAIDANKYKLILQAQLNRMTGVDIRLDGPMNIRVLPFPHVELKDVNIKIDMGKYKQLDFQVNSMSLGLPWRSFYQELKEISEIDANSIIVSYVDNKKVMLSLYFEHFEGDIANAFDKVDISSFKIKHGSNDVKGNMHINYAHNKTFINGIVETDHFHSPLASNQLIANEKVILNKILQDEWLKQVEAQIAVKVNKLQLQDSTLENAKFDLSVKDNRLTVVYQGSVAAIQHSGKVIVHKNKNNAPQIDAAFKVKYPNDVNSMDGEVKAIYEGEARQLQGKIKVNQLKLPISEKSAADEPRVSKEMLHIERLRSFEGDFVIEADELLVDKFKWQKAIINAKVKKNSAQLTLKGLFHQGEQESKFDLTFNDKSEFTLTTNLVLKHAQASEAIKFIAQDSKLEDGKLNFQFNGHSKGTSVNALMTNISGNAVIDIQQMKLLDKTIDSRHVDVFAAILKTFKSKKNETLFECVAIKLDFVNGIAKANQSIALETPDIYALGAGTLNLHTKKLDFAFDLQPRSNMNVELGSLDHVVYLQGTLDSPQVTMSSKGLIKEGGTLVLGVATGGLSLLAEKLYKVATKSSPCKQVLSRG